MSHLDMAIVTFMLILAVISGLAFKPFICMAAL